MTTPRRKADGRATLRDIFAIARNPRLSADEVRLWLLYRSYETKDGGGAFVGDELLTGHIGKSVRSVKAYRSRLLELGYLERELRGPNPAAWRAVLPSKGVQQAAPQEPERSATGCTPSAVEVQEEVQPAASLPHTPSIEDEYGSTGKGTPAGSWTDRACVLWSEAFGGVPNRGRIGRALKPLVKAHGAEDVLETWERYLAQESARFASPDTFAAKFGAIRSGAWSNGNGAGPEPGTREWLEQEEARILGLGSME